MNNIIKKSKFFPRPLWFMRQAGRYLPEYRQLRSSSNGFLDMCLTPHKACEITLQPIKRFPDIDAAILFADILIIPYALGLNLDFIEKTGPVLSPVDLKSPPSFSPDSFLEKTQPIMETLKKVKPHLKGQTLIGFAGAPWTVAAYMLQGQGGKDMAAAKAKAYENPHGMANLLDTLTAATISYLLDQIKAGAEMIQLFESWAGVLPEPYFDKWCVDPTLKIIKEIKEKFPTIPIFIFPRGASQYYKKYFENNIKPDGVSLDTNMAIDQALKDIPGDIILQGGMDPQLLKAGGTPMLIEAERILTKTKDRKYIFNLGHGMTPDIPIENVEKLIQFIKGWRP
tara:strand:- start:22055 stop:23074 length:1020 start_codon:yes stop_codon:yes gene_type:complete